jgi:UDP-N-acetylglucosamine--N-acetylmuramyl-(pentapeptide) pyrophosphoryl-undecaprenol N-acetylglucosamine transferase
MLAVLSGGGTAGHINPALALADVLAKRGWEVRFAGTPTGVEARLVAEAGIPFKGFEAAGFNRNHPTSIFKGVGLIEKSTFAAKDWFKEIKPDVVVGFGGYVSIPVGRAAEKMGIPVVVHEQNSVMGMANKYLAKKAARVCLTYDHAAKALANTSNVVVTGNPVRASIFDSTREEGREMLGIPVDARMLLVFGGSLGARHINQAMVNLKDRLLAYPDLHIVHVTGPKELETVTADLALSDEEAKRWMLFGYQNQMGKCMAATDAIVSRAGATSLAEISARAIPALLVPFPYATEDHQTMNAKSYVEAGCADMIADSEVEGPEFAAKLCALIEDAELRASMTAAARQQKTADAARLLADEVEAAARRM